MYVYVYISQYYCYVSFYCWFEWIKFKICITWNLWMVHSTLLRMFKFTLCCWAECSEMDYCCSGCVGCAAHPLTHTHTLEPFALRRCDGAVSSSAIVTKMGWKVYRRSRKQFWAKLTISCERTKYKTNRNETRCRSVDNAVHIANALAPLFANDEDYFATQKWDLVGIYRCFRKKRVRIFTLSMLDAVRRTRNRRLYSIFGRSYIIYFDA